MSGGLLRVVLGDQCDADVASLRDLDRGRDVVLMAEVMAECTYVRHHPRKIALVLSAMRHLADALRADGVTVRHVRLDDPANAQTLRGEVTRAAAEGGFAGIVATHPGEWRVLEDMRGWGEAAGLPLEIRDDDRFLASIGAFAAWAGPRRSLRMEFFYREMRRRHALLMEGDAPCGGKWNLDAENRAPLPKAGLDPPAPPAFPPDAVTREVMELVGQRFGGHFGRLEGFDLPVTRAQALEALADFVEHRLAAFGDHQDAMQAGQPVLYHALVSTSLNCGLLRPLEVCRAAEAAWQRGEVPLNAAEGFVRQVLGWREYVRGLYWLRMPDYAATNALEATRPLPGFYWTGATRMRCLAETIGQTRDLAYAHHIQRLMVTGNFALLCGFAPAEVEEWYLIVYADAYEWVELPNVHGMSLYADGGVLASKPYAASGAYIDRMSDYCGGCAYDPKRSDGPRACPFNFLYWDFVARHAERFSRNPRMALPVRTLARMAPTKVAGLRARARAFLDGLGRGEEPIGPDGTVAGEEGARGPAPPGPDGRPGGGRARPSGSGGRPRGSARR